MTKKRILLIFPDVSERSWHKGYFHYGLAHISSYLKLKVKDVEISLLSIRDKNLAHTDIHSRINEFSPDIVGFTSTSHSFPLVETVAKLVKKINNNILTVCGGIHLTINPEDALFSPDIDVVVCGDGEYPMEALVNEWIEHRRIPDEKGLWYRKDNQIVNNGLAMVTDLDSLPDPDWELFDFMNLDEGSQGIGGLMLSRGCPYKCSYCCNHKIADVYKDNKKVYIRFKSVEKSISEIKNFISKFPELHTLYFDDDILPLKKQWFLEFAKRYKEEINMPYWCNIRPNLVDEEIVDAFVLSGCVRVGIGIESGNEKIRNEVLKRDISDEMITKVVSLLKRKKVYVYSFNMVGIPGESKQELMDTICLNAKLNIDKIQCSVFYPYKHTSLYDIVIKQDLSISKKSLIEYSHESILKFSFAQKNRIHFTVLTMDLITKIYRMFPQNISEIFLKAIYAVPSAVLFFPVVTIFMRRILSTKKLSVRIRKLYRWIIIPPPTAITMKQLSNKSERPENEKNNICYF